VTEDEWWVLRRFLVGLLVFAGPPVLLALLLGAVFWDVVKVFFVGVVLCVLHMVGGLMPDDVGWYIKEEREE